MMWLLPAGAAVVALGLVLALQSGEALTTGMAVHSGLMMVAWNILLPAGAVVARYYKVTSRQDFPAVLDNRHWWVWHRRLQYLGVTVATAGFAAMWLEIGWALRTPHAWFGLIVLTLGWFQIAAGSLRGSKGGPTDPAADPAKPETWRGDHYDMTRRRVAFEYLHKGMGWAVLALSSATVMLGIGLIGDTGWLLFVAGLLQGASLLAILDGIARRRWVDTYTAIWGVPPPTARARPQPQVNG